MRRSLSSGRPLLPLAVLGLVYAMVGSVLLWPDGRAEEASAPPDAVSTDLRASWASAASPALPIDASVAWASETPPAQAFADLEARAGANLYVSWDAQTGTPRFLSGGRQEARLPYTPSAAERGNAAAIARGFLDENRALFRLASAAEELSLLRVEPDAQLGFAHVRLDQRYNGLPVWGRQLVVHLDEQGRVVAVGGQFLPAIDIPSQPTLGQQRAEELALAELPAQLEPAERARVKASVDASLTRLMVYVSPEGKPTLTWQVTIMTERPLGQWRFFVNARRPVVTHAYDSIEPIKRRITFSAENTSQLPGIQVIDEGERSRDEIAQAAHDGAGVVYDYYFSRFQRDAYDNRGSPMVSTVHYGSSPEESENAAWVGELEQMIYGDGGQIFRPLPFGLDVVGHEFTHGVIDKTSQLIYEGQSGALNESYADVFGALIDGDDWVVGEDVVKSPPFPVPYLRSLEDPNAGGFYDPRNPLGGVGQPATMDEYANLPISRRYDNGGVHINSGIPNRVAFLVAQALDATRMEQIYYRALTNYLSPGSDFTDAANASVQAATDLYGQAEADAVRAAFAQVGIDAGGGPVAPAPPPDPSTGGQAPPPQPEQIPEGCTELVVNGGFEADDSWVEVVLGDTRLIDPEQPHTGSQSAWLGGTDKEALQIIYQDIAIPANATQVQLSYWRYLHEETTGLLGAFAGEARFSALIANTDGDVLGSLQELSSTQGDDTWRQEGFDISRLAGRVIRLGFSAENPPGNVSSIFIDDVSIVACTTGEGPAAPPTGSEDLIYIQGIVSDSDTGRGIEGAQVLILRPDITASQAAADDNVTADEVISVGVSDGNGFYQIEPPVQRGQVYSVIILAPSYRPIVADGGFEIPADAPNPSQIDAQMRRVR
jgi:Zn-dependent metalloprotease